MEIQYNIYTAFQSWQVKTIQTGRRSKCFIKWCKETRTILCNVKKKRRDNRNDQKLQLKRNCSLRLVSYICIIYIKHTTHKNPPCTRTTLCKLVFLLYFLPSGSRTDQGRLAFWRASVPFLSKVKRLFVQHASQSHHQTDLQSMHTPLITFHLGIGGK